MQVAYEAARIAANRRQEMLEARQSFATESVFSHPSKLDLIHDAQKRGFRVMVFHISVDSADLSVARVSERVREGGHRVPEHKIRARFERNGALIRQAVLLSDLAHVFDNSGLNMPPVRIMTFKSGRLSFALPELPPWALRTYAQDLSLG